MLVELVAKVISKIDSGAYNQNKLVMMIRLLIADGYTASDIESRISKVKKEIRLVKKKKKKMKLLLSNLNLLNDLAELKGLYGAMTKAQKIMLGLPEPLKDFFDGNDNNSI